MDRMKKPYPTKFTLFIFIFRELQIGLVPKKGLEPPHPCEYMDLNHARLPIPPLRHEDCARQTPALDGKYSSILKGLLNVSNPPASKESSTPAQDLQSDRQD